MTLMLVFLYAITYAVLGMLLCLWIDGLAERASDRYIGSSAGRSFLVWILWPISLPTLLLLAIRLNRRGQQRFADIAPRRPLTLVDGS